MNVPLPRASLVVSLSCATLFFVCADSLNAAVSIMSSNMDATQIYSGQFPRPGAASETWHIPDAVLTSSVFGGEPVVSLANGSLHWTGNALDQDLSAGGVGYASFSQGGLLQWSGTILHGSTTYSGLLFEGTVDAFEVQESQVNRIDILGQPTVIPVSGSSAYFNANNLTMPWYFISMQGVLVSQDNDDLETFEGNIDATAGGQFVLVGAPEPATASLLTICAGALLLGRRPRGKA